MYPCNWSAGFGCESDGEIADGVRMGSKGVPTRLSTRTDIDILVATPEDVAAAIRASGNSTGGGWGGEAKVHESANAAVSGGDVSSAIGRIVCFIVEHDTAGYLAVEVSLREPFHLLPSWHPVRIMIEPQTRAS